MTYEEFKKELLRNVTEHETEETREVRLLEKGKEWPDLGEEGSNWEHSIVDYLQNPEKGNRDNYIQEDSLYVQWGRGTNAVRDSWNVRSLYDLYKREGWQSVLPAVTEHLQKEKYDRSIMTGQKKRPDKGMEQLILRLINYDRYRDMLEDSVFWKYGDMVLILCIYIKDATLDLIPVSRSAFGKKEPDMTEILTQSLLNSCLRMPPRLFMAEDIRFQYAWEDGVFMPGENGSPMVLHPRRNAEGIRGYRLTTAVMRNGALAIFYPGVMERLAELIGEDYYVGFSSVHEAILHPVSCKNPNEMLAAIRHVNAVFDKKDMLSDKVYRYWGKQRKLLEIQ